jgi:predicted nucleotidyltransferase
MRRDDVIGRLRQHRAEIRRLGVRALYLFGSTARGEAGPESDVDLYFDYDDPRFSLIELAGLQTRLAELLGAPIDLMTRGSLHPRLRQEIEQSALQVF